MMEPCPGTTRPPQALLVSANIATIANCSAYLARTMFERNICTTVGRAHMMLDGGFSGLIILDIDGTLSGACRLCERLRDTRALVIFWTACGAQDCPLLEAPPPVVGSPHTFELFDKATDEAFRVNHGYGLHPNWWKWPFPELNA